MSHPSCVTGDSSPSYLLDSVRVIPRLRKVFEHFATIRFFVMLRDPVRRAQSHYAMVTSLDGTPQQIKTRGAEWRNKSLEQVIQEDLWKLKRHGLIPYWDMDLAQVDQVIFDEFVGSTQEDEAWENFLKTEVPVNTGSHNLVSRGMYELNLRPWFRAFHKTQFLVIKLEDLEKVQPVMTKVWNHLGLPHYQVEDESAKNTRSYSDMNPETRALLARFYEPHNRRLQQLLDDATWTNNPWKCE